MERVLIAATGDVVTGFDPPESAFQYVMEPLRKADIKFTQVERVYSERGEFQQQAGSRHARQHPRFAATFKTLPFDVLSIASNHSGDWGPDAAEDTAATFKLLGISTAGGGRNIEEARKPAVLTRNGVRIAFLAYASASMPQYWATATRAGNAPMRAHTFYEPYEYQPGSPARVVTIPHAEDLEDLVRDVKRAKQDADLVVVSLHWGVHFTSKPCDYQPIVAHAAIDAGANAILGHHPHRPQGLEVYKDAVIFYSIGSFAMYRDPNRKGGGQYCRPNMDFTEKEVYTLEPEPGFVFDLHLHKDEGGIVYLNADKTGIAKVSYLPTYVNKTGQPEVVKPDHPQFTKSLEYLNWAGKFIKGGVTDMKAVGGQYKSLRVRCDRFDNRRHMNKTVDSVQQRLTEYAISLNYEHLAPDAIHTAKARVIDTLGALIGGFFGPPSRVARDFAAQFPNATGATVIGTRMKTATDIAAFVNATTARYVEMTDFYHWPGSAEGHPSDVVMPLLAVADSTHAAGRDLITAVVLAYEVYSRISDVFRNPGFDPTNFACLGTAIGAGKLMGLSGEELSHCISMAVVPNAILRQVRTGHLSMFKAAAAGQAGRAGVFAAMLARAGMEGPHLPFEGKAGWCDHVAGNRFTFDTWGGGDTRFKILDSEIKHRPSVGATISSILAAEKVAPLNPKTVEKVTVEVYRRAKERVGTGEHVWNPQSRETADHSVPYVVAATLMDGTVTPRSFNEAHLWNPQLRALMQRIEVVENSEFTVAYARIPPEHLTRVTVITTGGERLVGESGGQPPAKSQREKDEQIEDKFRGLAEEVMGVARMKAVLAGLWRLEVMRDVAEIPPAFTLV